MLFVAMKLLLAWGRGGQSDEGCQFHGKSRALSSSSAAVMIELRIASTIDEFVTRARLTRDNRARGNEYDLEVVATHQ